MKHGEITLKSVDPNKVVFTDGNKLLTGKTVGNGTGEIAAGDHNHDTDYAEKYYEQKDVFVLDINQINTKSVYLTHTPINPSSLNVQVVNGVELIKGVDYEVTGSTVTWNGYFLENVLVLLDELIVTYKYT